MEGTGKLASSTASLLLTLESIAHYEHSIDLKSVSAFVFLESDVFGPEVVPP